MRKNDLLILARHLRPDLLLLDVNLPDISGFEVCRRIKGDADLEHTDAQFSHSICPKCERMLYGEFLPEENR